MDAAPWRRARLHPARGVTVIELVIVVAVIGVLAALAMPLYQAYAGRAQFAEALQLLRSEMSVVIARYAETGSCVDNPRGVFLLDIQVTESSGQYMEAIRVKEVERGHRWHAAGDPDYPYDPSTPKGHWDWHHGLCEIEARFKRDGVAKALQSKKVYLETVGVFEAAAQASSTLVNDWVCKTNVDARYRTADCEGI